MIASRVQLPPQVLAHLTAVLAGMAQELCASDQAPSWLALDKDAGLITAPHTLAHVWKCGDDMMTTSHAMFCRYSYPE